MTTPPASCSSSEIRVLVTGSRTWASPEIVSTALDEVRAALEPGQTLTVIHGANRAGADAIADAWAIQQRDSGVRAERHPADWRANGKAAGMIRNTEMIRSGADLCLAFIRDQSPGASHCAQEAERAGIPTSRWQHPAAETQPVSADATTVAEADADADAAPRQPQVIQGELFQLPDSDEQEWAL